MQQEPDRPADARRGLRAQAQPRFVPATTDSDHDFPLALNRLAERVATAGPNQISLPDITYVPTAQGWMYLPLVMDLWSRKIIGWAMDDHLRSELVIRPLQMAHATTCPLAHSRSPSAFLAMLTESGSVR